MAIAALNPGPVVRASLELTQRVHVLAVVGLCALGAGLLAPGGLVAVSLFACGLTVLMLAALSFVVMLWHRRSQAQAFRTLADFIAHDNAPGLVADGQGEIRYVNDPAADRFGARPGTTLAEILKSTFADPPGVIFRLQSRAETMGSASEDVVSRSGHLRLTARQMGQEGLVWRIEEFDDSTRSAAVAERQLPALTLGRHGAVLYMNEAARELIGERVKSLDRIVTDLPLTSGKVHRVSTKDGPQACQVTMLDSGAGRTEVLLLAAEKSDIADAAGPTASGFDDLPVPLLTVSADGAVLRSNREARKLLDAETTEGRQLAEFMEGLGRSITDWLREAAAGRGLHRSEFLRLSRSDREVFVQVTLKQVTEDGAPALVAVLNDATELKTLEAQFVQSQKMQAIGQLAGGVAHDFNNLLTAISGHCDLLLLRHDQGDPDYGDLVQINQNANRAAALVGQLLAFSRKQTLQPEVLDLRDTLSDLTHLLNRLVGEKVRLTLRHDPVLQSIRADKRQLEQVMMNLVVNARDAMPQGGEILIETETLTLQRPLRRDRAVVAPGEYVSVKVSDEGMGIAPDKLQKIFEPFFTTKRTGEGTGLGLSTVYGIVKQTGGFIFVDSVLGAGTVFTLLIPVHHRVEEAPLPLPAPKAQAPARQGEGVVLLVEDEAPVRAFASRALRLRGFTVIEAESAEDALKTLEDPSLVVDVFVTDVVMPGLDGPTWVRKALVERPDVRVVFVSGYAEDAFDDGPSPIPNSTFLPKPFSLNDLTDTVNRQLN